MRLLAFDLDGTLLDRDHSVPARTLELLARLREHGCRVAVITGRADVPPEVLSALRPEAVAVNTGGLVMVGGRVIADHHFTPEQARALVGLLPTDRPVFGFGPGTVYVRDPQAPAFAVWQTERRGLPLEEAAAGPLQKLDIELAVQDPATPELTARLRQVGGVHVTSSVSGPRQYLTVTPEAANKGTALRLIAQALGIPMSRTVAFGDSENDLAMFEVAGVAVQVGEAECLLKVAHHRVSCSALGLPGWLEIYVQELARELA
ncbi:HAD family hydrolase [Deinococcus phoenicis]|uniref:HAD family hydrolase n=1 Tax=Deinococcus phoenicis TaxID=1476583 RepID=A0A016QT35_9DEIO|nr:HAD family hydrolase [Deinococcus phoenicis]EYB69223.1 HAD family hydrolase [Deinococcus phoenicis]